ncbi:YesL family protein [Sutcliffiella rhizosphaerae]|uniref:DUF624 domain-containing protein n=1 Tax=Sutcliffiella rhizosphaerae TaxID=2880967 RepID=A0ABM8YMN8_9BACI|nr:YesL family protein [Sutcliffiella rhizosphaerae]CAG9621155.1 putative protein YesV [Sutcliffiella rhizosphaerae]
MPNNSYMDGFYKFCLMFARLAYVNILWIFFILLGLGIFGFFPSTVAMFTLIRQWVQGNVDEPVFRTFWNTYKREFVKTNLIGITYYAAGLILYIDILYFSSPHTIFLLFLYYFFWVLTGIYLLLGIFLFPVYVHYQLKWWQYFRSTLLIMLMNPLVVVSFLLVLGGAGILLRAIPGLIPLFSGSAITYILMLISYRTFSKMEALTDSSSASTLRTVD